ncbi:hypothetical protein DI272_20410 [Streptomyces sp. Act143]|uniref:hypothetical protein n=1 Tax=Streptomyces sp. Act143 TaxID=2200760 RepID=UPI000D673A74|nr:hypothetical protein [Streptomyces sp. Act143]PWI16267.1 hypothetical protein DI272_20410 [Streptomyces sp. Act143]
MGWGETRRQLADAWKWSELHTAAATAALQVPVLWTIAWIASVNDDDYGSGLGGALAAGFFLLVLFVLPLLTTVHAALFTMPAVVLARVAARRTRGPEWLWQLGSVIVLGVFWAAAMTRWSAPVPVLLAAAGMLAAFGLLPLLAVAHVRRRARAGKRTWGFFGVWLRSAGATFGLCVLIVGGAIAATFAGLLKEYEPPTLTTGQRTGVWRGDGGALLNLRAGGRAEFTDLPLQDPGDFTYVRCDGTGTWSVDREGRDDAYAEDGPEERDGVVLRLDGGCGAQTYWTIGGTRDDPELFVVFGDPDSGELRILKKR